MSDSYYIDHTHRDDPKDPAMGGGDKKLEGSHSTLDSAHTLIFANERLPGPLPLKTKPLVPVSQAGIVLPNTETSSLAENGHKEIGILYLSQLRKSPYPINGCMRINHRSLHSHFKRYSDIKSKGQ